MRSRAFWGDCQQAQVLRVIAIAGDRHLRATLEQETKALGIGKRVHFLG